MGAGRAFKGINLKTDYKTECNQATSWLGECSNFWDEM